MCQSIRVVFPIHKTALVQQSHDDLHWDNQCDADNARSLL